MLRIRILSCWGPLLVAGLPASTNWTWPGLERLVLWAMGRFETAGLPAPSVASITFDEDSAAPQCAAYRTELSVELGSSHGV
jgi:hypothetical protein